MTVSKITRYPKLKGALAFVCLGTGLLVFLSLVSYYPLDPSWKVCPYCEAEIVPVTAAARRSSRRRRESKAPPAPEPTS